MVLIDEVTRGLEARTRVLCGTRARSADLRALCLSALLCCVLLCSADRSALRTRVKQDPLPPLTQMMAAEEERKAARAARRTSSDDAEPMQTDEDQIHEENQMHEEDGWVCEWDRVAWATQPQDASSYARLLRPRVLDSGPSSKAPVRPREAHLSLRRSGILSRFSQ